MSSFSELGISSFSGFSGFPLGKRLSITGSSDPGTRSWLSSQVGFDCWQTLIMIPLLLAWSKKIMNNIWNSILNRKCYFKNKKQISNITKASLSMFYVLKIKSATHLVPNPFDPRISSPQLAVPLEKHSHKNWPPWTNGPHQIWSQWTNGPQKFGPCISRSPHSIVGDQVSRDDMHLGPIVSQSHIGDHHMFSRFCFLTHMNDRYLTSIILLSSLNLGWWYVIVYQNWRCHCGSFSLIEWIFRILIQVLFQDSAHCMFQTWLLCRQ